MDSFIRLFKRIAGTFCLITALFFAAIQTIHASGVVNTATDAALRAALVGGGTVTFAIDGTIVLTNTISIANSTIIDGTGNTVVISGGNAFRVFDISASGVLTMTNMTVANGWNLTAGGFYNAGSLSLVNCTVSNNTAYSIGQVAGGILDIGTLSAVGCTFFGNVSSTNLSSSAVASAITLPSSMFGGINATMSLLNCTFFGNSIPALPSGNTIFQSGNQPSFIINCTIAGGVQYFAGPPGQPGSITLRNTIAFSSSGDTNSSNNLIGPNPGLAPLADNGGPTLTMALLPDSPAINAANGAFAPPTDQRGFSRPYGGGYDIGAFETAFIGTNAGAMHFTSANYDVLQTNGVATITVYRDNGATGTVSVHFATSDGTAIAGQDYTATNGTFTFNSGEISKSFTVPIRTNPPTFIAKTVNLTLSNPTGGATLGTPSQGVLNILPTTRLITSNDEAGLRSAMSSGGVLLLVFDGTITLTNPLVISTSVSLDASGHDVTISGSNVTRLFNVQPGVTLSLDNLSLADGLARGTNGTAGNPPTPGGPGQGGAVFNDNGILLATDCSFLRNVAIGGIGAANTILGMSPSASGAGQGGAIYNLNGQAMTTNCFFQDNGALGGAGAATSLGTISFGGDSAGGVIYTTGGETVMINCLVSSNRSISGKGQRFGTPVGPSGLASGGAIEIAGGQLTLSSTVLSDNWSQADWTTAARGGAITQTEGSLMATESLFQRNWTKGGQSFSMLSVPGSASGGGLCLLSGTANITNSALISNRAQGGSQSGNIPGAAAGGAIYSLFNVTLLNCTVAENIAQAGDNGSTGSQGGAYGGGLYNNGGTMVLNQITLANNAAIPSATNSSHGAIASGGGIFTTNGIVSMANSIVASSAPGSNSFGSLMDFGHNLSSDASCNFSGPGSLNNIDPKLGPLGDYGGQTLTMPLLSGSPAIDAGNNIFAPPTDQRGHARPFGSASDIGAFESSPPYTIVGQVSGFTLNKEVSVVAAAFNTATTGLGHYSMTGFPAATYSVFPSDSDFVFYPSNRVVTVGPDQIGVDFNAYGWNMMSFEGVSTNSIHLIYAGTNGQTIQLLASSNLAGWFPISTNTVGSSNLLGISVPIITTVPKLFFRTVGN